MFDSIKVTDAHIHYAPQTGGRALLEFMERTGTDSAVIQAVSHTKCLSLIPGALMMKDESGGKYYVFGSPDLSGYYLEGERLGAHFKEYTQRMIEAGMDGVKLLEGKPQMRKSVPIPDFDAPCWEKYWEYLEQEQVPITWHVNDPESHWGKNVSEWVKKQGWWYDESFINNEVQYAQVLTVLERHKYLRVILAHFFFMSAQLERLDDIMERYPNVMVDITPGIEMYENFSHSPENAAAFFDKYQDRIIYGTDIGGRCILTNEGAPFNERENLRRPLIVREFLTAKDDMLIESDGDYLIEREPFIMRPLGLQGEKLEKIINGNIRRQIGHEPNRIERAAAQDMCAYVQKRAELMAERVKNFSPDMREAAEAERYFA